MSSTGCARRGSSRSSSTSIISPTRWKPISRRVRRTSASTISDERALLLETGGGLVQALPMIADDPFLVVNSDNLWIDGPADSLRLLASHWDEDEMDALLLLVPHARAPATTAGVGDFHMDRGGRLRRRKHGPRRAVRLHRHPDRLEAVARRCAERGRFRPTSSGTARSRRAAASARSTRGCGSTSARRRRSRRPRPRSIHG